MSFFMPHSISNPRRKTNPIYCRIYSILLIKASKQVRPVLTLIHVPVLDMPLLDTTTARGLLAVFIADLVLQILSFVAETEREHIRTRQREGIAAAQARGVRFGRPMLDPPPCFDEVVRRYRSREITVRTAASLCGMSPTSFWRKSSALGVPT
jgi:DNA invertase Pin-like site-specific DNA recombinase